MSRRLLPLLLSASLAGCAVGPNFHRPVAPAASGYTREPLGKIAATDAAVAGGEQHFVAGLAVDRQWWRQFASPQLDAIVAAALHSNTDLAAARAAIRVAQETYRAQRGILFPQVDASASTLRARSSQYLSPVPSQNIFQYNLQTAQVNVGYTLDLFGGNRRQVESARAQYEAQQFQGEAAELTLAANVVVAALQEASLRDQVAAAQAAVTDQEAILAIVHRQRDQGAASGADVAAQEGAVAQARAALPPLGKALAQQQDLIAYLTGRTPAEAPVARVELAALSLPRELPMSLPSQLVNQRPDIRSAEANLHAASAAVGVAIANRLPQLTLSAAAGGQSNLWSTILSAANHFWSIGAGIAQPIFQGGALLHKQRAAEAGYKQADAQYRSTVLGAFQNVADVLHALESDGQALDASQTALDAAQRSLDIARRQYSGGAIAYPTLLNAQVAVRQSEGALIQAEAARMQDTVALYQALGGGWNGPGAPAAANAPANGR